MTSTATLSEPLIVTRGYQLCALLTVCGHTAHTLDNVPDGAYRDKITSGLTNMMVLAEGMAQDLLIHAERFAKEDQGSDE